MRKINNYNEFISESKLELLLEAKIGSNWLDTVDV